MKKVYLALLFLSISLFGHTQTNTIQLLVKGMANKEALLTKLEGDMNLILDTIIADEVGMYTIQFNNNNEVGFYKFIFPQYQNAQVPFIYNNEEVSLFTNHADFENGVQVLSSVENSTFYSFKKLQNEFNNNIDVLEYAFAHYSKDSFKIILEQEYSSTISNYRDAINYLVSDTSIYVSHYISSAQSVIPPTISNQTEKLTYLKSHYFDNIDFSDTTLFQSELIPNACISYLGLYAGQFTEKNKTQILKQAVDTILFKTILYPKSFDFVVDYLLNGFESMGDSELVAYISEAYLQQNSCSASDEKTTMQRKALSYTELAVGEAAPNFVAENIFGEKVNSKDLYKKPTVIVFWASWCGHCMQALPQILEVYNNSNDYNIVTISIDTNKLAVQNILNVLPKQDNAIHICDELSWESPIAKEFYLYATPTIILIKDKKIIAKPIELQDYTKQVKKFLTN